MCKLDSWAWNTQNLLFRCEIELTKGLRQRFEISYFIGSQTQASFYGPPGKCMQHDAGEYGTCSDLDCSSALRSSMTSLCLCMMSLRVASCPWSCWTSRLWSSVMLSSSSAVFDLLAISYWRSLNFSARITVEERCFLLLFYPWNYGYNKDPFLSVAPRPYLVVIMSTWAKNGKRKNGCNNQLSLINWWRT